MTLMFLVSSSMRTLVYRGDCEVDQMDVLRLQCRLLIFGREILYHDSDDIVELTFDTKYITHSLTETWDDLPLTLRPSNV